MMKNTSALLISGIAAIGASVMAADVDLSKLPPPAKQQGVTFDKDIKPLFEASCVRCHGADRPRNGLQLDKLETALKGSKDHKVIVPGSSEKSPLVLAVARLDSRTAMPPAPRQPRRGGPGGTNQPPPNASADGKVPPPGGRQGPAGPPPKPLTAEQVGLIRAWVDQGAK